MTQESIFSKEELKQMNTSNKIIGEHQVIINKESNKIQKIIKGVIERPIELSKFVTVRLNYSKQTITLDIVPEFTEIMSGKETKLIPTKVDLLLLYNKLREVFNVSLNMDSSMPIQALTPKEFFIKRYTGRIGVWVSRD